MDSRSRARLRAQQRTLAKWINVPEGTPVVVTRDDGSKLETRTRSPAWLLGEHTAVVMVEGISGAYLLDRIDPAPTPTEDSRG